MGLAFSRPGETATMGAPIVRTPFTDITSVIGHYDDGPCFPYELRWIDCLEAYGPIQGKEKCKFLFQDFNECAGHWKQLHRVRDIRQERNRQWIRGIMGKGPRTNLHEDPPPQDSYSPDNLDDGCGP